MLPAFNSIPSKRTTPQSCSTAASGVSLLAARARNTGSHQSTLVWPIIILHSNRGTWSNKCIVLPRRQIEELKKYASARGVPKLDHVLEEESDRKFYWWIRCSNVVRLDRESWSVYVRRAIDGERLRRVVRIISSGWMRIKVFGFRGGFFGGHCKQEVNVLFWLLMIGSWKVHV